MKSKIVAVLFSDINMTLSTSFQYNLLLNAILIPARSRLLRSLISVDICEKLITGYYQTTNRLKSQNKRK